MRNLRTRHIIGIAIGVILLSFPLVPAMTNVITMGVTTITDKESPVTPEDLKPEECTNTMTNIIVGTGTVEATTDDNTLLLGSTTNDTLIGHDGDDCLVGGAGTDELNGGPGNDICIGSPSATYISCETQLP